VHGGAELGAVSDPDDERPAFVEIRRRYEKTDKPIDFIESLYPVPLVLLLVTTILWFSRKPVTQA